MTVREPRPLGSTACHRCRETMTAITPIGPDKYIYTHAHFVGDGMLTVFKWITQKMFPGRGGTSQEEERCPDCKGTGWIDGFVPPV